MNKIPYINIADTEVWMIHLMPFSTEDRTDYELVNEFQQKCVEEKIFGMGWVVPCFSYGTKMTDDAAAEYVNKYNAQGWTVSGDAVNGYKDIRKGDYVIMRLKNSHYYVGKVSSDGAFFINKPNDPIYGELSWGGTVEKWVEFSNDGELPSEIVGRFSQRIHSTIQRIAPYRQRLLVISMYENSLPEQDRIFNIPKLHISYDNFVRSLNYMELEDLVALYISDKHNDAGYRLIPSSCKVSQQNYEFRFVSKGRKPITCQVKNQQEIDIDHYIDELSYEKIYIFSGCWNDEQVAEKRLKYSAYSHIYIISRQELFDSLKANNIFVNDFYDYDSPALRPDQLSLDGYNIVTKIKSEKDCTLSDNFACFLAKDGFFYSAEFGALILSYHIMGEDLDRETELIKMIYNDLNKKNRKDGPI